MPYHLLESDNQTPVEWRNAIQTILKANNERITILEEAIIENKQSTLKNTELTKELINILVTGKGGIKFFSVLGRLIMWTAGLLLAISALWGLYKGRPPV